MGDKKKNYLTLSGFLIAFLLAFSIVLLIFLTVVVNGYKVTWQQMLATVEQSAAASREVQSKQTSSQTAGPVQPPPAASANPEGQTGGQGNGNSETVAHDFSNGKLLGSKESDKYHCEDCIAAQKILPQNEIWFDSVDNAVANNYKPCGICYK